MSPFAQAADPFCNSAKTAVGHPEWGPTRAGNGRSIFWLLEVAGRVTPHRLHVEAYPAAHWRGYTVMVDFSWQERPIPTFRLNSDDPAHAHNNRLQRPVGLPAIVRGNRIYLWADNRLVFNPNLHQGLPYARQMSERNLALDNAIRHIAGEALIDVSGIILPDYPSRDTLV